MRPALWQVDTGLRMQRIGGEIFGTCHCIRLRPIYSSGELFFVLMYDSMADKGHSTNAAAADGTRPQNRDKNGLLKKGTDKMWKIGDAQPRIEDPKLVRGEGAYTDDRRAANGLFMYVLRSTAASARLDSMDIEAARAMPGVVEILTGADLVADGLGTIRPRISHPGPDGGDMRVPEIFALATDLVQFVGHPIAIVLAETQSQAEDAAEAIDLELTERPATTDVLKAIAEDAPKVWPDLPDNRCYRVEKGNGAAVEAAIETAAHVSRARLKISRVTAVALEPRAAVASWSEDAGYTIELGTQSPHRIRDDLAKVMNEPSDRIRVVAKETGGSFGMKNFAYTEYSLALWAARRTGRPVQWLATRTESFLADSHAREQWADATLALDSEGRFTALDVTIYAALGACMGPSTTHPQVANLGGLAGVYRTPAIRAVVEGIFVNSQMVAPYRGAGRPEATYVIERMIDIAAAETGWDRAELRRINLIGADEMPYKTGLIFTYDSGDFTGVLDRALDAADWSGFPARRDEAAARGRLRGIGIANPIEIAGGPANKPHPEFITLRVAPQGNASLVVGSCDSGQGHATAFRQLLVDRLGLDPEAVDFSFGDTGALAQGTGTFGSRSLSAVGAALYDGIDQLTDQMRPAAAQAMGNGAEASDITFADGLFMTSQGDSVTFLEALAAAPKPIEIESHAGAEGATFPNGCHVCEIEVDPETGQVEVVNYTVVDDVGTVINPLLVKGQIAGGVAQGLGQALMEEILYDPETGQILSATFMDYAMPRAADLPGIDIISFPVPTLMNPLGAKGAGEAGTVGALAAGISAVADALSPRGVTHLDMPATPSAIWRALEGNSLASIR
mgnify:CR=1 FL=1